MKKIVVNILTCLFLFLFPALFYADGSLSFAPPVSDVSVIFLGNVFGIVDGVLHGTGSQIMGSMFGVFNAAVLALGGIVIIYTLMVSTVNTAHEGQMLGQKWSSMWVPIRSTLGLALLIPKASGYCLMQIFVMWITVQGVGAADKVWQAALSYLNRGGVIVQAQINPITDIMGNERSQDIKTAAYKILSGQVCMLGLQTILNQKRDGELNSKGTKQGLCYQPTDPDIQNFCDTPVPDFTATVNAVQVQTNTGTPPYTLNLPNMSNGGPYAVFDNMCGTIKWAPLFNGASKTPTVMTTLSRSDLATTELTRAIAVQQLYTSLLPVAQAMINNNPVFSGAKPGPALWYLPKIAVQTFGVPYLAGGPACTHPDPACTTWGLPEDGQNLASGPLFQGSEFQIAVMDYNSIMLPTLTLISQSSDASSANNQRAFIQNANSQGWLMAGSYFFDLARLSSSNMVQPGKKILTDLQSGLEQSLLVAPDKLKKLFQNENGSCSALCKWFNGDGSRVDDINMLLSYGGGISTPTFPPGEKSNVGNQGSTTVNGFVANSLLFVLPGQSQTSPTFAFRLIPEFQQPDISMPNLSGFCGKVLGICVLGWFFNLIYTVIIKGIFQYILQIVVGALQAALMAFLALPLMGMASIFSQGLAFLQQPNVNPVIALANMGINYINFATNLWIFLTIMALAIGAIPVMGVVVVPLLGMVMPLLMAWLGTMLAIGFSLAYFVPFLPYMIFTFGGIAWMMAVIEAMVAAPIVALGITHPEGEGPFGKGEQAILILMNVFLRPALMIIGYVSAIILTYVGVWMINAGFQNVSKFLQGDGSSGSGMSSAQWAATPTNQDRPNGYTGWAGVYAFFFGILIYTTMYLTVVQKAFTLITALPDKVLRWIGGQQESLGQETAQWSEESKKQVETGGKATEKASGQTGKEAGANAQKALDKAEGVSGGEAKAEAGQKPSSSSSSNPSGASGAGPNSSSSGSAPAAPAGGSGGPAGGGGGGPSSGPPGGGGAA